MAQLYGFVSPEGEFFPCQEYGHVKLADRLVREKEIYGMGITPEQILAKNGYMTVNQCMVGIDYFGDDFRKYKHLSDAQVHWIDCNMDRLSHLQRESVKMELQF